VIAGRASSQARLALLALLTFSGAALAQARGEPRLSLDEALGLAAAGKLSRRQVSAETALRAALALERASPEGLVHLLRIAKLGGAEGKAAGALCARLKRSPEGQVYRLLEGLPWRHVRAHMAGLPRRSLEVEAAGELRARLWSWAERKKRIGAEGDLELKRRYLRSTRWAPDPAESSLGLCLLRLPTELEDLRWVVVQTLAKEQRGVAELLLKCGQADVPRALAGLARADPKLRDPAHAHLEGLLKTRKGQRDPSLLPAVLALRVPGRRRYLLRQARRGPLSVRILSLRELPRLIPKQRPRVFRQEARERAEEALQDSRLPLQEAGLSCLAKLGEATIDLVEEFLAEGQEPSLRRAALRAATSCSERREAIELLIGFLEDPEVAVEVHKALRRLTGLSLPSRARLWRARTEAEQE